jgi:sugar phosphate isomerase/epimerase
MSILIDARRPFRLQERQRIFASSRFMNITRRNLFKSGAVVLAAGAWGGSEAWSAQTSTTPAVAKSRMHLGLVTYNLAKDWTVDTIIHNCEETGFEGVELRTSHAHGVEVNLTPKSRAAIRDRFRDSKVQLMGLGSTFEYHTPDQAKLRKDIEATKEYILLAQDVGAGGVKVRPNGLPKEVPVQKTLEQIGQSLREIGEFGKDHGVQIRLEVHGPGSSLLPNIKTIMDVANHPNVGVCWNSNQSDLEGAGFDANFDSVKDKIFSVHMRDLYLEEYPFRKLLARLNQSGFNGFCLAEIPESKDPVRVMHYFRGLWMAYQGLM